VTTAVSPSPARLLRGTEFSFLRSTCSWAAAGPRSSLAGGAKGLSRAVASPRLPSAPVVPPGDGLREKPSLAPQHAREPAESDGG